MADQTEVAPRLRALAWLLLVIVLAAALRFYSLGAEPLWLDEAFSWRWAHQGYDHLWGAAAHAETTPPLYYSIQRLWLVFGESEAALRSFSAAAGVLTVPVVYLVGRQVAGSLAGLLAALFLATAGIHVAYSQEARVYAFLMLTGTTAVWGLLVFLASYDRHADPPAVRCRRRLLGLGGYTVGTTLALYGHNAAVFLPLLANLAAAWWWATHTKLDRRFAIEWLTANLVPLGIWLWWLPVIVEQTGSTIAMLWLTQPSLLKAAAQAARMYAQPHIALGAPWSQVVGLVLPLGLFAIWRWHRRRPMVVVLLVFVAGVPAATWLFGFLARPIWIERTLLWPIGLGLVLAACGVLAVRAAAARAALLALVLVMHSINLIAYYNSDKNPSWDRVVADVAAAIEDNDAIICFPGSAAWPFSYYANRAGISHRDFAIQENRRPPLHGSGELRALDRAVKYIRVGELDRLPARFERVWVIFRKRADRDPHDTVLMRLQELGEIELYRSYPRELETVLLSFERPAAVAGSERGAP